MSMFDSILDGIGTWLARVIQRETSGYEPFTPSDPETLRRCLQPGDIILIEGNQKLSAAIKYLTQSTWSHAALYVGDALPERGDGVRPQLIEAILGAGVTAVPLAKYETYNTRICRPVGMTVQDRRKVVDFAIARLGSKYDARHVFDLARYLVPTPPVPVRWRRRLIALGSGSPTRTICSTLIAEAYQSVPYPILPLVSSEEDPMPRVRARYSRSEILHIRHHSLFTPRDFDVSPFFAIVKPTIESGFDYRELTWSTDGESADGEERGD
jgi:hypothetical protein